MSQRPATPKARRLLIRMAAALGLADRLTLQPSERAALARRSDGPPARPARVIFLVPLVGQAPVSDWAAVVERLDTTLRSFRAQTDPRWQAVICCQGRPALPDDPRITHLPFDDPTPGNDKWRKLGALCDHLPALGPDPAYVMTFDADDLLHRETVAQMLAATTRNGFLFEAGLVLDHATGRVARADRPSVAAPLRKPLWKLCGSCMALPIRPDAAPDRAFLQAMTGHEHRMFPHLARLAGFRLRRIGVPRVLYILNHGENFGARRGRVGFKTRFVQRFALSETDGRAALAGFPAP